MDIDDLTSDEIDVLQCKLIARKAILKEIELQEKQKEVEKRIILKNIQILYYH